MGRISRRTFLALSAGVVVAACSNGDDAAPSPSSPETDPALTEAVPIEPSTSPATVATPDSTDPPAEPASLPADPFRLGVASGDPRPDSVILWTRLIGTDLPASVPVTYELATDEEFADVVVVQELDAVAEDGHSLHADATGLAADSWYFYRFQAGGFTSPVGRTRTVPAAAATPDRLVLGSASCQNFEDGFYAAHADIAAAGLDLLFWLGDYIYEGAGNPVGGEVIRSHEDPEPLTLDDYRARYTRYKADPQLQASHASCPWVVTWDDHEVDNNYAALISQDGAPTPEFATRRAAAYRAWWEHQPVRLPRPDGPDADYPIYRGLQLGTLIDVSVLDTRQYRADQACGDVTLNLEPACAEVAAPDRTLLGEPQEAWLFDRLGREGTTWNVLAQQVIMADSMVGDAVLNYDQWDGYPAARDRLLGHVADNGVENLVVLTGDIHFAGVARLRAPNGAVVGIEFVDTSISSNGNVPTELESLVGSIGDVVGAELAHRGWTKHVVTPETWTAEFRIVDDATVADSSSSTWKSFLVVAGTSDVAEVGP